MFTVKMREGSAQGVFMGLGQAAVVQGAWVTGSNFGALVTQRERGAAAGLRHFC